MIFGDKEQKIINKVTTHFLQIVQEDCQKD